MLAADRDATVRAVELNALEINGSLLNFRLNNLTQVQQAAVLLSGFSLSMLVNLAASNRCPDSPLSEDCIPVEGRFLKSEHPLEALPEHFCESLGVISFMFLFQVVIQTLLLQVMAPKLALLGPDGSFQLAVTQLRYEQEKIIPVFILGLVVFFTGAWCLTLAICTQLALKLLCSLFFLVGVVYISTDCLRIMKLFHLKSLDTTAQITELNLQNMGSALKLSNEKRKGKNGLSEFGSPRMGITSSGKKGVRKSSMDIPLLEMESSGTANQEHADIEM